MSIRQSLLAILDQGPCYGYQLRSEFERRTGGIRPLNVGQIYNTLERLERDGMVVRGASDGEGHVFWHVTNAGREEAGAWLARPIARGAAVRDELAVKLALAATLPGVDVQAVIVTERAAVTERLAALPADADADFPTRLAQDAVRFTAEAELRFIEHAASLIQNHPQHELALAADRPRRGRPARVAA
ncbi:MAG: PadR family transcriptional regulator [Microbacterium sp.]